MSAVGEELTVSTPHTGLSGVLDTFYVTATLLFAWQVLHWFAGGLVLPSPLGAANRLALIATDPEFAGHAWETGRAFATALLISLIGGLGLGVLLGVHRLSGEVAEPMLVALYSIPKITLYPVILLLFGLGISAKIAFGALHGIIPVIMFSMNAVRNIRPVYLRSARAMRLAPLQTGWHVMVPATLPEIVSGFRLGFALTLLGTLIGEMFASQRGIGYLLLKAMESNEPTTITALALLLIGFATCASWILLAIDNRLHRRT
jgi:NitT/TauT family transport system permease protein